MHAARAGASWYVPAAQSLHAADEPVASEEEPMLLEFVQPVLEDNTHRHAFYFESDTARREAMRILGVAV